MSVEVNSAYILFVFFAVPIWDNSYQSNEQYQPPEKEWQVFPSGTFGRETDAPFRLQHHDTRLGYVPRSTIIRPNALDSQYFTDNDRPDPLLQWNLAELMFQTGKFYFDNSKYKLIMLATNNLVCINW